MTSKKQDSQWYVYILECGDGTYYTGMTDDLQRRFAQHQNGTGAKYTRGRGPLNMVYWETVATRSDALRREYAIKHMTRADKIALIRKGERENAFSGHS